MTADTVRNDAMTPRGTINASTKPLGLQVKGSLLKTLQGTRGSKKKESMTVSKKSRSSDISSNIERREDKLVENTEFPEKIDNDLGKESANASKTLVTTGIRIALLPFINSEAVPPQNKLRMTKTNRNWRGYIADGRGKLSERCRKSISSVRFCTVILSARCTG
jgi:hypothetical protein